MLLSNQAHPVTDRHQPQVGVVDAKVEAELGARGEHAIGLVGPFGDQVIDEDSDVGLRAVERQRLGTLYSQARVDAGHDALCGGLLVAGGSVDLPGEV